MLFKKEELEILAALLREDLVKKIQRVSLRSYIIPEDKEFLEKVKVELNIFRKIKKEIGLELSEEEALRLGLVEEVPRKKLWEYATTGSLNDPLYHIARYFLKCVRRGRTIG
jgi:hypothetical protein